VRFKDDLPLPDDRDEWREWLERPLQVTPRLRDLAARTLPS
jgi:hypothetical protein